MFLGWLQYLTAGCGGITEDFFEMRMNSQTFDTRSQYLDKLLLY